MLACHPGPWPSPHFIHFQTPKPFCLVPAGPVLHNTSQLCLKACINKRKSLYRYGRARSWDASEVGVLALGLLRACQAFRDSSCIYVGQSAALLAVIRPTYLLGGYRVGSRRGICQDGLCVSKPNTPIRREMGEK